MAVQLQAVSSLARGPQIEPSLLSNMQEQPSILVVDDENGPRQALRMLLKEDYNVQVVEDVDSALEVLERTPIELVITDVRMPKRTGVDLLREAKKKHPDIQVIVLTGYGQLETAVKAVEFGAFSYMEKPFDNDAMLDMVRAGIEKFRDERDRRAFENLALEANRFETMGRVVSGMMHDLGSPLTVINSQIDLVSMDPQRQDVEGRLTIMRQQVEHCGQLVRATMDFMRNDADSLRRHKMNDVIATCLQVAGPQLRDYCVQTETELADDLPLVSGHMVLMRQAMMNLIMNACHAQDGQEPERIIRISTWQEDGYVAVGVADNGTGIAEHLAGKVFETFYTTKGENGTGLGLSVVRNVMRKHGGSVSLETASPARGTLRGACFVLRFPVTA
jgi:signal transduction histidine kinase